MSAVARRYGIGRRLLCRWKEEPAAPIFVEIVVADGAMNPLLPSGVKVHLAFGYTDMRKGMDGLALLVQEAIGAVFPQTTVQTCIVHLIRNSMAFVSWKDRKRILPDIKAIYRAETAEAAAAKLDEFDAKWGARYPAVAPSWRRAWQHVVPMFAFPPAIRKMIYTTNALESLHRSLRKIIKTRGSFPTDEAAAKLLFLAIRNAGIHWRAPVAWNEAMGQFAIMFADRFPTSAR